MLRRDQNHGLLYLQDGTLMWRRIDFYNWSLYLTSGNEDIGSGVGQSFNPRYTFIDHFPPIQPYRKKIGSPVALLSIALLTKKKNIERHCRQRKLCLFIKGRFFEWKFIFPEPNFFHLFWSIGVHVWTYYSPTLDVTTILLSQNWNNFTNLYRKCLSTQ